MPGAAARGPPRTAVRVTSHGDTGPIPLSVRRRSGAHAKPDVAPRLEAVGSSASTVPGAAIEVRRLARLTVVPNTSPIRASTCPLASPTRTSGSSGSASISAARSSAIPAAAAGGQATNSTSSPTVLMMRPPCEATTSDAVASNRCTSRASSRSDSRRTTRVNETRSAKPMVRRIVVVPGSCSSLR